jgi:hypothetical protein
VAVSTNSLTRPVKAAAALDCLDIALVHWGAADGRRDLVDLLDEAIFTKIALISSRWSPKIK